ncbi:MFS transporter [Actinophytocola xanthii]|uniref:MFS transporter n=1 Tax=Actinophytocola xanthii TaxID=1912961 RepID=A0A1Q8CYJ8_9PSEU|nr:MFS transporter [Actinophytocola xanthii]OLF19430.1 MFS transporter [Actinophytocola xanthii]
MRRLVPPAGPVRVLAAAQLADAVGLGGYLVCSALYFTRVVGLSATQVGFGLTVGWAVGLLAGVPLGHLADRRGPRGVAMVLAVVVATALLLFLTVRSFVPFVLVASLYGAAQCGLVAARQALLAALVPAAERTAVRAVLQVVINGGLAVGGAFGGLALHLDSAPAYLTVLAVDALGVLASAALLSSLPPVPATPRAPAGQPAPTVLRDRPYVLLTALNMVLQLHIPLITLATPLWIIEHTAAPRWTVAVLLVLNTASVVLFQVRVARRVHDLESAGRQVRGAGVFLLLACAAFAASAAGSSPWVALVVLVVAAALQVVAEMMQASGAWQISFDLAPPGRHGQYQGFFGSGFAVARMLGPLLLATLVLEGGTAGWLLLGAAFLSAGVATVPAVRMAAPTATPPRR